MDVGLKWVFVGAVPSGAQRPLLCLRGRKYTLCVAAGHPVRVLKRMAADFNAYRTVVNNGTPYSVERAIEQLESIGKRNGITQGAVRLLQRAREELDTLRTAQLEELDEDSFQDEEEESTMTSETPANQATQTTDDDNNRKETTVTKAKKKSGAAAKPSAKAKATAAKKPARVSAAKLPKTKSSGSTPFRAGTAKEKAFLEYKAQAKVFEALEHGEKKAWAERLAKKLGLSAGTVSSWISGQFRKALSP